MFDIKQGDVISLRINDKMNRTGVYVGTFLDQYIGIVHKPEEGLAQIQLYLISTVTSIFKDVTEK